MMVLRGVGRGGLAGGLGKWMWGDVTTYEDGGKGWAKRERQVEWNGEVG